MSSERLDILKGQLLMLNVEELILLCNWLSQALGEEGEDGIGVREPRPPGRPPRSSSFAAIDLDELRREVIELGLEGDYVTLRDLMRKRLEKWEEEEDL